MPPLGWWAHAARRMAVSVKLSRNIPCSGRPPTTNAVRDPPTHCLLVDSLATLLSPPYAPSSQDRGVGRGPSAVTAGRDAPTGETDTPFATIGRLGDARAAFLASLCEAVTHDTHCTASQDGRRYLRSRGGICQTGSAATSLILLCSPANVTNPESHSSHEQPSPGASSAGAGISLTVFFWTADLPEKAHSPLAATEGLRFSALARLEGRHLFHALVVCDGPKGKDFGPSHHPTAHAEGPSDFLHTGWSTARRPSSHPRRVLHSI
jgi:hypothetical protein